MSAGSRYSNACARSRNEVSYELSYELNATQHVFNPDDDRMLIKSDAADSAQKVEVDNMGPGSAGKGDSPTKQKAPWKTVNHGLGNG